MNETTKRNVVLLVEDDPTDVLLMQRFTRDYHWGGDELQVATDGQQALSLLREKESLPDLVLLDLNLPGISGIEVLKTIRDDPDLRDLPVVVLSGSGAIDDVRQSYANGANSYLQKQTHADKAQALISAFDKFWFNTVLLPNRSAAD